MKIDKDTNILIVGLGLLGGSYAKALKKQGFKVSAITKDESSVKFAIENKYVDYATTEIDEQLIGSADLVIFALYPHIFIEWVEKYGSLIKKGAIVTDVTGVKGEIVGKIQQLLGDRAEFISAHPMAGREVSGVENSDESIFKVANYIVVPTERNTQEAIDTCAELGRILDFKLVSILSVDKHDEVIAFLSQLTHCIAVSLMCANDSPDLVRYTGDSFRDLTRIAKINDEMWSELFLLNKTALLKEMDSFRAAFDELYLTIADNDREKMRELMRRSTQRRKMFEQ